MQVHDMQVLEAWADCAAMLMDLPESISSTPEFAQVMGLCIDEMQLRVAQWYPFFPFLGGSRFPYSCKVTSPQKKGTLMVRWLRQDNIEFFFGRKSVEDVDFSTLVLEWATLRWFHQARAAAAQAVDQGPVLGELD